MTPAEHKLWLMDQRMNRRGIRLDREGCEVLLNLSESVTARLNEILDRETDGAIQTVGQVAKIADYCGTLSAAKPALEEALASGELSAKQALVAQLRLAGGKSSASKIPKMLATMGDDDRSRGALQFCGTRTKRWAGRNWQPHNLPRESFKPDEVKECLSYARQGYKAFVNKYPEPLHAISMCLRGLIVPDLGNEFIIADYSAIEARVLAWYAGQYDILQIYREGGDVYKEMAGSVFRKDRNDVSDSERFLGKTLVLGSGYGLGYRGLHRNLAKQGTTEEEAKALTYGYRNRFDRVVEWWGTINNAFDNALDGKYQNRVYHPGGLKFRKAGNDVYIELGTGNRIWFHEVRRERKAAPWDENQMIVAITARNYASEVARYDVTHSILAENICSATAREILARGILRCEAAGYEPIMSVHDEVVLEIEKDFGSIEEVDSLLCEDPYFAKGLPLATEAFRSNRYTK